MRVIQSSLVSTTRASASFVSTFSGTELPQPVISAYLPPLWRPLPFSPLIQPA